MKKKLLWLGFGLLLVSGLAYLLKNIFSTVILVPALASLKVVIIVLGLIPQSVYWVIFLFLLLILSVNSLKGVSQRKTIPTINQSKPEGRVQTWSYWIEQRSKGSYFKWRLANRLSRLVLDLLAEHEQLTFDQARAYLEAGKFDLPDDLRAYILAGVDARTYLEPAKPRFPWRSKSYTSPLDLPIERVIQYLEAVTENQLTHADGG